MSSTYANVFGKEPGKNSAGGPTFTVTAKDRILRFLTLGTEGGTYYATEKELTKQNAEFLIAQAQTNGAELVETILNVSVNNRAPKVNATIFALAVAAKLGDDATRKAANAATKKVLRTGTHLFLFNKYLKQFGGYGRGTRRALASFYLDRPVENTAYQILKYRQREGTAVRDILRLAHPETTEPARKALFDYVLAKGASGNQWNRPISTETPSFDKYEQEKHAKRAEARKNIDLSGLPLVQAYEEVQAATTVGTVLDVVARGDGISWEMIPDQFINEPSVWELLIAQGLPQTALMRQLPRLTKLGLLAPMGSLTKQVVAQLTDSEKLLKARVHPINVLVAQKTYASGKGDRGSSVWTPSRPIVDALDAAFYKAYGAVQPSGARTLLALDVSGSMSSARCSNLPLTAREVSAAMALVTAATEDTYEIVGFTGLGQKFSWHGNNDQNPEGLSQLSISPNQRMDDVIKSVSGLPMGPTDCALPMIYAKAKGLEVDTFVIYTDSEHWAGVKTPDQALQEYRETSGINAKLIVVATTATEFSIGDPDDLGVLNVAGFDSGVPHFISEFSKVNELVGA